MNYGKCFISLSCIHFIVHLHVLRFGNQFSCFTHVSWWAFHVNSCSTFVAALEFSSFDCFFIDSHLCLTCPGHLDVHLLSNHFISCTFLPPNITPTDSTETHTHTPPFKINLVFRLSYLVSACP